MRLTVLGSCGTYPAAGRACSGYLLEAGGARVWVDAGSGSLANLLRVAPLHEVDAVWVSHLHADHVSDLLLAFHALAYGPGPAPAGGLEVWGPSGWARHIEGCLTGNAPARLRNVLAVRELRDDLDVRIGGLHLRAVVMDHGIETYGLIAQADGARLSYTADTGPGQGLQRVAAGADVLVSEAGWNQAPAGRAAIHLTPEQAGDAARAGGAARLLLTHIRPGSDVSDVLRRAGSRFGAGVELAMEGGIVEVGQK